MDEVSKRGFSEEFSSLDGVNFEDRLSWIQGLQRETAPHFAVLRITSRMSPADLAHLSHTALANHALILALLVDDQTLRALRTTDILRDSTKHVKALVRDGRENEPMMKLRPYDLRTQLGRLALAAASGKVLFQPGSRPIHRAKVRPARQGCFETAAGPLPARPPTMAILTSCNLSRGLHGQVLDRSDFGGHLTRGLSGSRCRHSRSLRRQR